MFPILILHVHRFWVELLFELILFNTNFCCVITNFI